MLRLVGSTGARSAFSSINRRWAAGLAGQVDFVDDDTTVADVALHQDWQSRFGEGDFPPARRRVAVRPWDYGPYPPRWVEVIAESFDELWVHSRWTAHCAVDAGVDTRAVRTVPLGVDPTVHRPDGPAASPASDDHVVILFVGAAVVRKGIDILVRAFADAFGPTDPVTLVIKDHTGDVFYSDQTYRDMILAAAGDPGNAPIVYIDDYMDASHLAALYRRADVLAAPYRAEGFALPVLEAMACGTVPLVPRFGACLDYCNDHTALFVESKQIALPVAREFATNALGFTEVVDRVDFCEIPVATLAAALHSTVDRGRDELGDLGRASASGAGGWTWERSVEHVTTALDELTRR
jgi:glycosyltransferase involved in cell wall biosynthesis